MKTLKQILKEFAPSENEDDGNEHHKGYTLGPMTHLYLHNIQRLDSSDGVKTGHIGTITTSGGHVVSVHHNTSDQEHGDPNTQAPSDEGRPVRGHTTVHSVLRNGVRVGNLVVRHFTHPDYNHREVTLQLKDNEKVTRRPSLSSQDKYNKLLPDRHRPNNIDPNKKEHLKQLAVAHRAMAVGNFQKVIQSLK
jgi:hypothetical protein